jgi:serine/threonine-protein kinase
MKLTREQWALAEELFADAHSQPAGQRLAWLERKGRRMAETAVVEEVKALIEASELDSPVPEVLLVSGEPGDEAPAVTGALGPWKVVRLLGRGGMGEVYLAERADGTYEQQVAVKLLKRGVDTDAVLQRFLRERRILGRLNHPNIARLLDAGATADGRPYLVMELVNGQPINEWCAQREPGVRPILELMVAVCEAVHAAHRQLVVHRDLKPTNVLIDDEGMVKLLDFGIAKLVNEDDGDATQTVHGLTLATPRYAAPEQLLSQPVTPASDVYSLGMLLYELLTGTLPSWRRNMLMAVASAHNRSAVIRPSAAVAGGEGAPFKEPAARRQRANELAGDLDQIVLKAVDDQPRRRYANAAQLADDLRRHLDGRPVLAQSDSWWYLARKFVVRNWVPVSAGAAVAAALLVGLALALWQARVARAEALRAERVKDFVVSVFDVQDPFGGGGDVTRTPRALIHAALGKLDQELVAEPSLHVELLDDLTTIQLQIGDLAGAEQPLEEAIRERVAIDGDRSLKLVPLLNRKALVLSLLGRNKDAEAEAQRALAILQQHPGADPLELARAQIVNATTTSTAPGATAEAARALDDALHSLERVRSPDDPETLRALYQLAEIYEQHRQLDLAAAKVGELVLRTKRRYGDQSLAYAEALSLRGLVLADANQPAAAVADYEPAIAIFRARQGERGVALSQTLGYMATQLRVLRRFEDSLTAYQEAEHSMPEEVKHTTANVLRGEGRVYLLLGQANEAEHVLNKAVQVELEAHGDRSGYYWYMRGEWARALAAQGKLAQAEAVQREAAERLREIMGPSAYQNAMMLDALAASLEMQPNRRAEAEALRRQMLQLVEAKSGKDQARWAEAAHSLEHNLLNAGTSAADAEGLKLCEEILAVLGSDPQDKESYAETLTDYAAFLEGAGRRDEARTRIASALEVFDHLLHPDAQALTQARRLQRQLGPVPAGAA